METESRIRSRISRPHLPRPGLLARILSTAVRLAPTGWKFYNRSIMMRKTISVNVGVVVPDDFQYAWAGAKEIRFMDAHPEATSSTAYERRIQRGDSCLCLKKNGELVGYHWIAWRSGCLYCGFSSKHEITFLPLQQYQAFTYDLYVYEAYRGRGLGTLFRKLMLEVLRRKGIKEVLTLIDPENQVSLRLSLSFGYEPLCMAYSFRIRQWSTMLFGPQDDKRLKKWIEALEL